MSETAPKTLVKKLAAVMGEVERIPKSGRNDFHKYDYATEADIVAAVRKGLADRHVMITHKVESLAWRQPPASPDGKEKSPIASVRVAFTAWDGESGESMVVAETVGEGQDSGDKAVYKALTGALKYAVLKLFLIPTGDDPEASKAKRPERAGGGEPRATGPTVFPNFGKGAALPIAGATWEHLEFHRLTASKSLADPKKVEWRAANSALLGAIDAEIARQKNTAPEKTVTVADMVRAATVAPPPERPRPKVIVDEELDGGAARPEDHARLRTAKVFHGQAVEVGKALANWSATDVGKWMRETRKRAGGAEVTAADVEALRQHLTPPAAEPGSGG